MNFKMILPLAFLALVLASTPCIAEDIKQDDTATQTTAQQEQPAIRECSPGFEKITSTTIYGPLGIVLKALEITLDKLYIIAEF